jgi:DNA-binding XRE family transcriptional regulator
LFAPESATTGCSHGRIVFPTRRKSSVILLKGIEYLRQLYASGHMTAAQCRAARGLLHWTEADLARAAGVSLITVRNFEAGQAMEARLAPVLMQRALEGAGISFLPGDGEDAVRLSRA